MSRAVRHYIVDFTLAGIFWVLIVGAFWLVEIIAPTTQSNFAMPADHTGCADRAQRGIANGAECAGPRPRPTSTRGKVPGAGPTK